jgi:hypothetical protein
MGTIRICAAAAIGLLLAPAIHAADRAGTRHGHFLYVPEDYGVRLYRVTPNGVPHPLRIPLVGAYAHPTAVVFHPNGRFAYVLCSHGAICQYRVEHNGRLAPLAPDSISVDENGQRDPSHLRFIGANQAEVTVSTPSGARQISLVVDQGGTLVRTYE